MFARRQQGRCLPKSRVHATKCENRGADVGFSRSGLQLMHGTHGIVEPSRARPAERPDTIGPSSKDANDEAAVAGGNRHPHWGVATTQSGASLPVAVSEKAEPAVSSTRPAALTGESRAFPGDRRPCDRKKRRAAGGSCVTREPRLLFVSGAGGSAGSSAIRSTGNGECHQSGNHENRRPSDAKGRKGHR